MSLPVTIPAALTFDEERELFRRWRERGDKTAFDHIVLAHQPLAHKIARLFRHYGLDPVDLRQEAMLGLLEAAARFEEERGLRFATFAIWWVRARVLHLIMRSHSVVAYGTTLRQLRMFFKLRSHRAKLMQSRPTLSENEVDALLAREFGVDPMQIGRMLARLDAGDHALDAPRPDGGPSGLESLPDPNPSPEEAVLTKNQSAARSAWLAEAIHQLNERERLILTERRMSEQPTPLKEIGLRLGITAERVRQIEEAALKKLKLLALRQSALA